MSHFSDEEIRNAQKLQAFNRSRNPLIILAEIYIQLSLWIERSHSLIEVHAFQKAQRMLEAQIEGVIWTRYPDDPQEVLNWIQEVFHDYRVNRRDTPHLIQALFANPLLDRREDPRL